MCTVAYAQNTMRLHYVDKTIQDIPLASLDSLTFINKDSSEQPASLNGSWMWGNKTMGYLELLSFNEDRTYTGWDFYFEYGFDTYTYGTYVNNGIMLNLWSNGYGYRRTYRWFITALTDNALEVMTQMGSFIYYRVRPEVIKLTVGGSLLYDGADKLVFADGFVAAINDNALFGISQGATYIQLMDGATNQIYAYKVVVE